MEIIPKKGILFCELLREKLEAYTLTQSELACKLSTSTHKVHRSIISNWTAGRHTPDNLKQIRQLALIFSNDIPTFQECFIDLCNAVIRTKGE